MQKLTDLGRVAQALKVCTFYLSLLFKNIEYGEREIQTE